MPGRERGGIAGDGAPSARDTGTSEAAITIGDIGEFALISRITARFPENASVLLGPGDDAAVVRTTDPRVVASTDLLVEDRHFKRAWSTPYQIGRRAAAQNLADIAAMGATTTALLVGLGAPADLPVVWAEEFADGVAAESGLLGAAVVGGDMVRSDHLVIAVTVFGDMAGVTPVTRAGARSGDVIALAGTPGRSAAGYELLRAGRDTPADLVDAFRCPSPPYREGPAAARAGARAMIDVSDGLLSDLGRLATASGCAMVVDSAALPDAGPLGDAARALGADPGDVLRRVRGWQLNGGEDHVLLATFPDAGHVPGTWRIIGRVAEGSGVRVAGEAREIGDITADGWDHFAPP